MHHILCLNCIPWKFLDTVVPGLSEKLTILILMEGPIILLILKLILIDQALCNFRVKLFLSKHLF